MYRIDSWSWHGLPFIYKNDCPHNFLLMITAISVNLYILKKHIE